MENTIGIVLDLSLNHEADGRRRIDTVKRHLVSYIKDSLEEVEDSMYMYHPDLTDLMYHNGDRVSAISNYETDGWVFNLSNALKQTLYVLGTEDPSFKKVVVLITDRLDSVFPVKKAVTINKASDFGCEFEIMGIGTRYNRKELEEFCSQHEEVKFRHCDDANGIASKEE